MIRDIINVTPKNDSTYDSDFIKRFTWSDDPEGSRGLLYVEFQEGGSYVYIDVPEKEYNEIKSLAYPADQHSGLTSGKYLKRVVIQKYDTKGQDYQKFEDLLDDHTGD